MLEKLPTFTVRQFMSYLAPGTYFAVQFGFLVAVSGWIFLPNFVVIGKSLLLLSGPIAVFLGFILLTLCYFIGVVGRLTAVESIEETAIRWKLTYHLKQRLKLPLWKFSFRLLRRRVVSQMNRWLGSPNAGRFGFRGDENDGWLTCRDVHALCAKVQNFGTEFPCGVVPETDLRFDQFLLQQGIIAVKEFLKDPSEPKAWRGQWEWLGKYLWCADRLPYAISQSFRICWDSNPERLAEFHSLTLPLFLESMGGEFSTRRSKIQFNRCKAFVLSRKPEVAGELMEREALVRMVAGLFAPLEFGKLISGVVLILGLCIVPLAGSFSWPRALNTTEICWIVFFSAIFWIANSFLLRQVRQNFHTVRMGEGEAVYSAYLISRST